MLLGSFDAVGMCDFAVVVTGAGVVVGVGVDVVVGVVTTGEEGGTGTFLDVDGAFWFLTFAAFLGLGMGFGADWVDATCLLCETAVGIVQDVRLVAWVVTFFMQTA